MCAVVNASGAHAKMPLLDETMLTEPDAKPAVKSAGPVPPAVLPYTIELINETPPEPLRRAAPPPLPATAWFSVTVELWNIKEPLNVEPSASAPPSDAATLPESVELRTPEIVMLPFQNSAPPSAVAVFAVSPQRRIVQLPPSAQ